MVALIVFGTNCPPVGNFPISMCFNTLKYSKVKVKKTENPGELHGNLELAWKLDFQHNRSIMLVKFESLKDSFETLRHR